MKITAISVSRLQLPSRLPFGRALPDFVTLMKPRVMVLAVFTALVGLIIAPGHLDPLLGSHCGSRNRRRGRCRRRAQYVVRRRYRCGHDPHRDAANSPRQDLAGRSACHSDLSLPAAQSSFLLSRLNVTAAALLAFTILFYVVVYTAWLKRRTPQNIVIGGAAGALPPVIGWAAATGEIGLEPLILFLIIFLWTPPHFWALSLNRADEYARAGVPMLPVVAGRAATTRQILIYSVLLVPASVLPWVLGFAGAIYGAIAAICGAIFLVLAFQLSRSSESRSARCSSPVRVLHLLPVRAVCGPPGRPRRRSMVVHALVA